MGSMITLPKLLHDRICRLAEEAYPSECCGLLLGKAEGTLKSIKDIWKTGNAAEAGQHNRYVIPPQELLEAENFVRTRGWEIVGVYHSHPDHPSQPSVFDRKNAILHYSYIILRVVKGRARELTCWTLPDWDSPFAPEELQMTDDRLQIGDAKTLR
jgi:proteasome lid subunit RPN8/RPN11